MAKTDSPVKVGIIGCGNVASNRHLPVLKTIKEGEVVALAEVDESRLNSVADKFQIEKRYTDYRELLHDPAVEAVGVCVPLQLHFEVASAALDAGKHLLLEKPLAMNLDEADRLIDQAAKTGKKVLVGFNKRWHRLIRLAQETIENGTFGPVGAINTVFSTGHHDRHLPEWRRRREKGGGSLIENGSHFYDICRFLLKKEIKEVTAISCSTERCDDESAVVTARTDNGVLLSSLLSEFLPDRSVIEIFGQECVLRVSLHKFDGIEIIPFHSFEGDLQSRLRKIAGFIKALPQALLQIRYGGDYNASFRTQWIHFIDCIRRDIPIGCSLEDGRHALQTALAAVKSACTGQTVTL